MGEDVFPKGKEFYNIGMVKDVEKVIGRLYTVGVDKGSFIDFGYYY